MNEKHAVILFAILLVVGVGAATVNSIKNPIVTTPTPSPTPDPQLFGPGQSQKTATQSKIPQQQVIPTPTSKQMKQYRQFPGILASQELTNKKAVVETDKGKIEFEILPDAPRAASNFIFLVRDGFYDGLTFHRVEPGFVIQGGDPTGTGSGGPGYSFEDETVIRNYDKGIVAMANSGPNTNGSQFFIMLEGKLDLPKKYTVFGKVVAGQDIVSRISKGDIIRKITIEYFASATPTPTPTPSSTQTPTPTQTPVPTPIPTP